MPSFRLYSQLETFYGNDGAFLAGGQLRFYEAGTTTPQNVFGDKALTVNNGPSVLLDNSGRPVNAIWGDTNDAYFVELYDADAVKQGEEDDVELPGGAGQSVPIPNPGEFITGDGTNFALEDLTNRLIPDMTGHAGDILGSDGTLALWQDAPADPTVPTLPVTVTADSLQVGASGSDFYLEQRGEGTAPASGGKTATANITWTTPFKVAPRVLIQITGSAPGAGSDIYPKHSVTNRTTTGATVTFSTKTGGTSADNQSNSNLIGATNFTWTALGTVADPGA